MARNTVSSLSLNRFLVLFITGLSFINVISCTAPDLSNRICKTTGCIEAAASIKRNMDTTVNPCDNFYKFACGKHIGNSIAPINPSHVSFNNVPLDDISQTLKKNIEEKVEESDPQVFKLIQSLYNTCMDTERRENGDNEEVKEILSKIGNWPVLAGESWNESSFEWHKFIQKLFDLGYESPSIFSYMGIFAVFNTTNHRRFIILHGADNKLSKQYFQEISESSVQAYYKFSVDVAVILGAERKQAEKEMSESLEFEKEMSKLPVHCENNASYSGYITVEELQSKFTNVSWIDIFNQLVGSHFDVKLQDEVNVATPSYFDALPKLLSKTPKRVIANYMIWRFVYGLTRYMNGDVQKAYLEYTLSSSEDELPLWKKCLNYISRKLPAAIGALYIRKNLDKDVKADVQQIAKHMRKSFDGILEKSDWMGEMKKQAARSKLNATHEFIAYPDDLLDNEKLDNRFKKLTIDSSSFLKSELLVTFFNRYRLRELYSKPINHLELLANSDPLALNAFYIPYFNSINVPAGILHSRLYTKNRPSYMNYAGVGYVIGHELTHGFDKQHAQLDNSSDVDIQKFYCQGTQCMIDQYNNYTVTEVELNVNGRQTLAENIADNVGLKGAYIAYEDYEMQNGVEPRLVGLPYTPRQLFWISAANVWCSKELPETLKSRVIYGAHSPPEFRIVGALSNIPEFSRDFKCPLGSPMNPVKKCTVW